MNKTWVKKGDAVSIKDVFMKNLGVSSLQDVNNWFLKSYADGYKIKDLDKAAELALKFKNKPVHIIGDYDVDGQTSTSILKTGLEAAGFTNVSFRIPRRFSEGFGINMSIIDEIEDGLIITCDNGYAQVEQIKAAKDKGISVIVIDHHLPAVDDNGNDIPSPADVSIDPNAVKGQAEFSGYCGAGLSYKFIIEVFKQCGIIDKELHRKLQVLAALGTMADVMELREENYVFVRNNLKRLSDPSYTSAGLAALVRKLGLDAECTVSDISFKLAPCLNAVSRLEDDGAVKAVKLLTFNGGYIDAENMAQEMFQMNEVRKRAKKEGIAAGNEQLKQMSHVPVPLVLYIQGTEEGVVGIIAGHFAETLGIPTIVLTDTDDGTLLKGSARSAGGFNMKEALDKSSMYLSTYGGHAAAAGLSLKKEYLEAFRSAIEKTGEGFRKPSEDTLEYDLEINAGDVPAVAETLPKYGPFGEGNPDPVFLIKNFVPEERYGEYVKFLGDGSIAKLFSNGTCAIGFDAASEFAKTGSGNPGALDFLGTISINRFREKQEPQIEIKAIRSHQ